MVNSNVVIKVRENRRNAKINKSISKENNKEHQ